MGWGAAGGQSVSQSVISRSRPALTPPPARSPAPPLPVNHKYRVLAPGGYSLSQVRSVSLIFRLRTTRNLHWSEVLSERQGSNERQNFGSPESLAHLLSAFLAFWSVIPHLPAGA